MIWPADAVFTVGALVIIAALSFGALAVATWLRGLVLRRREIRLLYSKRRKDWL